MVPPGKGHGSNVDPPSSRCSGTTDRRAVPAGRRETRTGHPWSPETVSPVGDRLGGLVHDPGRRTPSPLLRCRDTRPRTTLRVPATTRVPPFRSDLWRDGGRNRSSLWTGKDWCRRRRNGSPPRVSGVSSVSTTYFRPTFLLGRVHRGRGQCTAGTGAFREWSGPRGRGFATLFFC